MSDASKSNTIHFIPYYFNQRETDGTILSLTMKLKYQNKTIDTFTIPVSPQILTDASLSSLRQQVGIKPTKANAGVIRLQKD